MAYGYTEAPTLIKKYDGYQLIELSGRQYIDCRVPKHNGLRDYFQSYLSSEIDSDTLDDFGGRYPVPFLVDFIPALERMEHPDTRTLVKFLKEIRAKRQASYDVRKAKGVIEMSDVEIVYPAGTDVVFQAGDEGLVGGVIKSIKIQHSFFTGPYFEIRLNIIHAIKGDVQQGIYSVNMPGFTGLIELATLPLRIPTARDKKTLTERGKKFAKFSAPGTYCSYTGKLIQPGWWSSRTFRADGRIVVDPVSFERVEPETWCDCMNNCGIRMEDDEGRGSLKLSKKAEVAQADYWRCVPFLYGFSLSVKPWGRLELDGLHEIQWRDDAWDQLVVDPDEKDLIFSLVKFHGGGFTDIIEGKGGGCIFLLHGEPGWGKTATAEAVAELLHKPLYSVSVGELGVDTKTLEASLRSILDVATIWDAVILLDEADIFLEKRDEHNIARNAMVGVFLRLLEYHNGVLFLTTNRVKEIDKAFYSRISVALHYKSDGKAEKIWTNLLKAAKMNPLWAKELYGYEVNGRQIKNSIRMAQTLARAKSRDVVVGDLKRACVAAIRFEQDMKKKAAAKA